MGSRKDLEKQLLDIAMLKLFYFGYILVLPMLLLPVSPIMVLQMFITMHLVTVTILSAIFQPAYIVITSVFPNGNEKEQQAWSWTIHQFLTTSNYSPNKKIFSWLIGGLNYQIDHHLFPNICHVHYHKVAGIVRNTVQEFNVPCYSQKTFFCPAQSHTNA